MAQFHQSSDALSGQEHAADGPRQNRCSSEGVQSSDNRSEMKTGDVFFIIPRKVTVIYGPYMFEGMMDYRTERLQGLKAFLERLGVSVELKPCLDHVNLCRIWFLDELIYSCKLTDLMCGGDGTLDPVCRKAAESLEHYKTKVVKGLRKNKAMTVEELKEPFCPCFQTDNGHDKQFRQQQKPSVGSSMEKKYRVCSKEFGQYLNESISHDAVSSQSAEPN